jgi:hypothetical protein
MQLLFSLVLVLALLKFCDMPTCVCQIGCRTLVLGQIACLCTFWQYRTICAIGYMFYEHDCKSRSIKSVQILLLWNSI